MGPSLYRPPRCRGPALRPSPWPRHLGGNRLHRAVGHYGRTSLRDFSMMARAWATCASLITSGGAKRMMSPWVGLASSPFFAKVGPHGPAGPSTEGEGITLVIRSEKKLFWDERQKSAGRGGSQCLVTWMIEPVEGGCIFKKKKHCFCRFHKFRVGRRLEWGKKIDKIKIK